MNWKRTLTGVGLVSATIASLGGAVAVLDIDIPRPAYASEIVYLAGEIIELDQMVTSQQLDDAQLRLYQNLREQNSYELDDQQPPSFLLQEQILLERKIDDLDDRLDGIREQTD